MLVARSSPSIRARRNGYARYGMTVISNPTTAAAPPNVYVQFARRWWWVVLLTTMLGTGGGVAYAKYGPLPYESTALIMVPLQPDAAKNSVGAAAQLRGVAQSLSTQILTSYVYGLASKALQGTKWETNSSALSKMAADKQLTVNVRKNSNLVAITASDPRPGRARAIANAVSKVFVEDSNARSGEHVEARKKQLEQYIDMTQQSLITSQLRQREQDLTKELRDQRLQLLQIQLQYQQELQRQQDGDRLQLGLQQLQGTGPAASGPLLADQQQLQQLNGATTASYGQVLNIMAAQQREVEATIATLEQQLGDVRRSAVAIESQLVAMGVLLPAQPVLDADDGADGDNQTVPSSRQPGTAASSASSVPAAAVSAVTDPATDALAAAQRELDRVKLLQSQQQQLLQREQALTKSWQDQRQRLRDTQLQYQQAVQRRLDLEQQLQGLEGGSTNRSGTPTAPVAQDQQRQRLTDSLASVQASLKILTGEQQDTEKIIADLDSQLAAARAALKQLPSDGDLALAVTDASTKVSALQQAQQRAQQQAQVQTQQQQAQQQRDQDRVKQLLGQRQQLRQRESDLGKQVQDQRAALGTMQLQYQTEVQRQIETERRLAAESGPQGRTGSAAQPAQSTSPEQQARLQDLAQQSADVRSKWLDVVTAQRGELERTIAKLGGELDQVRDALSKRPSNNDPLLDAAFATAYSQQLKDLTQEYVKLQVNGDSVAATLSRYGDASEPVASSGKKKILAGGIGGGAVLGTGVAFLLERWRLARKRRAATRDGAMVLRPANGMLVRTARNGHVTMDGDPVGAAEGGWSTDAAERQPIITTSIHQAGD